MELELDAGIASRLGPMVESMRLHYMVVANADNDSQFTFQVASRYSFDGTLWSTDNNLLASAVTVSAGVAHSIGSPISDTNKFGLQMKYFITAWNTMDTNARTARVSLVLELTLKT